MRKTTSCALLGLGLWPLGCAQVLDIPEDPEVVGRWRCLSEPLPEPVPLATTAEVQVQACDFMDGCTGEVSGMSARLCRQADVYCTNPVAEDIVDVDGLMTFSVPTPLIGFNGYLEVTPSTALCTDPVFGDFGPLLCGLARDCNLEAPDDNCQVPIYARALLFFNPPIFNDTPQPLQLPLLRATDIPIMLQAAGTQLDPTTGNLFITALDCDGQRAAGVTYSMQQNPSSVTQLYVHEGLPNKDDLETDDSGVGGFLGVPVGYVNVTGYNEDRDVVGETAVHAAPFTMTYTAIMPH
jgi:hypothetical protein